MKRTRRRKLASNIGWRLLDLFLSGLGLACLYYGMDGVLSGHIQAFSKREDFTVHATEQPVFFWVTAAFWLVSGLVVLGVAFNSWRSK